MKTPSLPDTVRNALLFCVQTIDPERVVLFGSRARDDCNEHSDFDFAVFTDGFSKMGEWARFIVELQERPITLQKIDWLLANECPEDLLKQISKEGITVYERRKKN